MKYYIYARKSTDSEDKQVQSIDARLVELRKYAQLNSLEIEGELIEKRTAKKPGRAPVGYKNDVYAKTVVIDRKLAPIVKQGFELYAEGQTTLEALSDWLFARKIKTDTGNRMSKDRVKFILTNTFYIGLFNYAGEVYEGKHKPIIEKVLFDKVQVVVKNRSYVRQQPTNDPKPYCGLLTCKTCGMSITATVKQRTQKNGNHDIWTYYHCSRRSKTIDCKEPAMKGEDLNIQLSDIIRKCQITKEDAKFVFEKIADAYEVASQSQNENRIANQLELETLTKQIGRLTDVYLADDIDREEYLLHKQNLLLKKREIEQKNTDKPIHLETRLEPVSRQCEDLGWGFSRWSGSEQVRRVADPSKPSKAGQKCRRRRLFSKRGKRGIALAIPI
ncbi:hypothetical protein FACS1894125_5090 [Actinomycetota bacterium]|nr:hypothetical protein FACS1894125_5090 [Actinomycetota bacterium]